MHQVHTMATRWATQYSIFLHLFTFLQALALILESVGDWSVAFLPSIYECLDAWAELPPIMALTLLLPKWVVGWQISWKVIRWAMRMTECTKTRECIISSSSQLMCSSARMAKILTFSFLFENFPWRIRSGCQVLFHFVWKWTTNKIHTIYRILVISSLLELHWWL